MNSIDITKVLDPEFKKQGATQTQKTQGGGSFSAMLKESIQEVNALQSEASNAVTDLAVGKAENIHSTLIAMEKAGLSFKLMTQVRNKVLDAYKEVMRMQV